MDQCSTDALPAVLSIDDQAANLSEAQRVEKVAWHHVNPTHDAVSGQFGNEHGMSALFFQQRQLSLCLRYLQRISQLTGQ
jgi:hypothetical protein